MSKAVFICTECGYQSSKWLGKCPECNSWNTFTEEIIEDKINLKKKEEIKPLSLKDIPHTENDRYFTEIKEFDRVTGGIIKGQTILISGEPGMGKSTLAIMIASALSRYFDVFYINGEESNSQIKQKFKRLGIEKDNIFLFSNPEVESVISDLKNKTNIVIIVDSIQTIYSSEISSLPGTLLQIKECVYKLVSFAKQNNIPLFLIGHITKSGEIAGPKVIEHLVDSVFFLDTDIKGQYRILRSLKNRFFRTDEVGFFTMEENGLISHDDIIQFMKEEKMSLTGTVFFPHLEGSRVIPTEVQALCTPSITNFPRRINYGIELNRFLMLIAILEKNTKKPLFKYDVYLNITNGLNISDTAIDFAVCMAIFSAFKEKEISSNRTFIGELGLSGEIRPVKNIEKRIKECIRFGFNEFFVPYNQKKHDSTTNVTIYPVKNLAEVISLNF